MHRSTKILTSTRTQSQRRSLQQLPRKRQTGDASHQVRSFKKPRGFQDIQGFTHANSVFFPMWGDVRTRTHCGARRIGPVGRQKTLSTCQPQSWRGAGAALWPTTVVVVVQATSVTRHRTRGRNSAGIRIAPPPENGQDLLCFGFASIQEGCLSSLCCKKEDHYCTSL